MSEWTAEPDGFDYYWRIEKGHKKPIIVQCKQAVGAGYLYKKVNQPKPPTEKDWKKL